MSWNRRLLTYARTKFDQSNITQILILRNLYIDWKMYFEFDSNLHTQGTMNMYRIIDISISMPA